MLTHLQLHQIGPAPDLEAEFGERLNLVTGDNGLGKTFLLDACWYALTRSFAGDREFHPPGNSEKDDPPGIQFTVRRADGTEMPLAQEFDFGAQMWRNAKQLARSDHSINQSL